MDNVRGRRREGCRSLYPLYIYFTCVTERAFTFLVSNTTHNGHMIVYIDDRGEPSPPPGPARTSLSQTPLRSPVRTKPLQTFKASMRTVWSKAAAFCFLSFMLSFIHVKRSYSPDTRGAARRSESDHPKKLVSAR